MTRKIKNDIHQRDYNPVKKARKNQQRRRLVKISLLQKSGSKQNQKRKKYVS